MLVGLVLLSSGSAVYDVTEAVDNTQSATEPKLLQGEGLIGDGPRRAA
jgi:hypothetical protein